MDSKITTKYYHCRSGLTFNLKSLYGREKVKNLLKYTISPYLTRNNLWS